LRHPGTQPQRSLRSLSPLARRIAGDQKTAGEIAQCCIVQSDTLKVRLFDRRFEVKLDKLFTTALFYFPYIQKYLL
jgi:hypothetical protein